jgi:hypothetical protein
MTVPARIPNFFSTSLKSISGIERDGVGSFSLGIPSAGSGDGSNSLSSSSYWGGVLRRRIVTGCSRTAVVVAIDDNRSGSALCWNPEAAPRHTATKRRKDSELLLLLLLLRCKFIIAVSIYIVDGYVLSVFVWFSKHVCGMQSEIKTRTTLKPGLLLTDCPSIKTTGLRTLSMM